MIDSKAEPTKDEGDQKRAEVTYALCPLLLVSATAQRVIPCIVAQDLNTLLRKTAPLLKC